MYEAVDAVSWSLILAATTPERYSEVRLKTPFDPLCGRWEGAAGARLVCSAECWVVASCHLWI